MNENYIIGIDLGGTKIAAAAFGLDGRRLGRIARLPTMATMQPAVTLNNLKRVVKQARLEAGVEGSPQAVGMGSSGPLDTRDKILLDKDSLPHLFGFNVGRFSLREFGAPLFLENDAACFALGEAVRGAGRSQEVVLGVTLGTGFGCGIAMGGAIYSGATNNAGEVAYCRVGDSDFDHACAGIGVVRQYCQLNPSASEPRLTAQEIGDLADGGDAEARQAWSAFGRDVGAAIGTVCCVLDPSIVVLGGSVGKRLDLFGDALVDSAKELLLGAARDRFRVRPSELEDAAGLTGAAEHARRRV